MRDSFYEPSDEISENILQFLRKCSEAVGKYECNSFSDSLNDLFYIVHSPIEQLFFIALNALARIINIKEVDQIEFRGKYIYSGLDVVPQFKIANYRVDFRINYQSVDDACNDIPGRKVIVECDSQQFHDRSEEERRYEKERDRFLQKEGYKVFRFTGSEILENPFNSAAEVLSYVTARADKNEFLAHFEEFYTK